MFSICLWIACWFTFKFKSILTPDSELRFPLTVLGCIWGEKIILLSNILFSDDLFYFQRETANCSKSKCKNCGEKIADDELLAHINECRGGYSGARQQTIPDYFSIEASNFNSAPFAKIEETVQSLKHMFPDISANRIENVLVFAKSWEDAVDTLVTNHPESASAVIQSFVERKLDTVNTKVLKTKREDIWWDAVRFYKILMAKKSNLFQKMVVEFGGEEDIDVGALTIECFTKFFEIVKRDLFETVKFEKFLIPTRSGGNLTLFKILGIAIGHSLFQGLHSLIYTPGTQW